MPGVGLYTSHTLEWRKRDEAGARDGLAGQSRKCRHQPPSTPLRRREGVKLTCLPLTLLWTEPATAPTLLRTHHSQHRLSKACNTGGEAVSRSVVAKKPQNSFAKRAAKVALVAGAVAPAALPGAAGAADAADRGHAAPPNGDGYLTPAEARWLNELPAARVSAEDLVDVNESSLHRLNDELRTLIQTPVGETTTIIEPGPKFLTPSLRSSLYEGDAAPAQEYRRNVQYKKATVNTFGFELARLYTAVEWTYDGKTITTAPGYNEWGTGSWGWTRCSTSSTGHWRNSAHTEFRVSAMGYFSVIGCPTDLTILTQTVDVHNNGHHTGF